MATIPTTGVGIFGPTRNELRQQYLKNLQGQFASAQSPYEKMGLAIGNIVGTAFGIRDPQLEQASKIESIYQSVAQMYPEDQTSPEFYRELSSVLSAAGLQEQAIISAEQARKVEDQRIDRQIKLAQFSETMTEKKRKTVDYYKKNPEQAEFRLTQLAEIIKNDPGNAAAIQEYEQITRSASEGAIEASAKTEKETLALELDRTRLAKYRKDLSDAEKFGPAQRWDAETDAARKLLQTYKIDITKPLEQQIQGRTAFGPMAGEISQAFERAVRRKTTEGGGPGSAPASAPAPAAEPAKPAKQSAGGGNVEAKVKATGLPYEPDKYEYRVLANGTVQRKKK